METCSSLIDGLFDEALLKFGWTEESHTNFGAGFLCAGTARGDLIELLDAVTLRGESLFYVVMVREQVLLVLFG